MVVLEYMLNRGGREWLKPVTPEEVAAYFFDYLTKKEYRKKIDFADKDKKTWTEDDMGKVAKLVARMPMSKFGSSSTFDGELFKLDLAFEDEVNEYIFKCTKEVCEYRLESYFEKKAEKR